MPRPSSARTINNITPAKAQENGTVTFEVLVPLVACVVAHKKENTHVT